MLVTGRKDVPVHEVHELNLPHEMLFTVLVSLIV